MRNGVVLASRMPCLNVQSKRSRSSMTLPVECEAPASLECDDVTCLATWFTRVQEAVTDQEPLDGSASCCAFTFHSPVCGRAEYTRRLVLQNASDVSLCNGTLETLRVADYSGVRVEAKELGASGGEAIFARIEQSLAYIKSLIDPLWRRW